MATKLEELNVTSEELQRFKAAFQDARFRELFAQYAKEISDPENRRRYEQEISEMERERGMDIQFIHPEPDHVLQTSVNGKQTCYLNVCGNALVGKAQCAPATDKEGRAGQHWSLPCTLTPGREELGPEGSKELIYDVVFHPHTLYLASRNEKFLSMVDVTALDTVTRQFNVVLDTRTVRTLSDCNYKGVPQASVLRRPHPGPVPKPQDPKDPLRFPYPYTVQGAKPCRPRPPKKTAPQEPTVPHYTIRHRSYVDVQDYRDARDSAPSPVPKELVITIDLPLLVSAADVTLHIEGKNLSLESQKPAYKLSLKLPYLVEDERGAAQFNKTKKQLVITVPVVQQDVLRLLQDSEPQPGPPSDEQSPLSATESTEKSQETMTDGAPLLRDSPECPIFTCSQDATSLTLIIHVKGIEEHSITSEVSSYQCEIRFCVKRANAPHVLFVEFLPQYNLNTNDIGINVSEDNMVIELTKSSECFGLWKNLYFGVNSNSLQERRFINEENVAEFLESGLRPSTIPWSTLEDQPLINVLNLTDERTHIRLNKPELEGEHYPADEEQTSDVSEVTERRSCQSDSAGLSDPSETAEKITLCPQEGRPCPTTPPAQTPAQLLGTEDSKEEDEGLRFKEIPPAKELDEDDLPHGEGEKQRPVPDPSSTEQVLKEADPSDASDHRTQCAFKFDNAALFELD